MLDLESYDNVLEKLSKMPEGNTMPLQSWDFFAVNFDQKATALSDANKLQEFAKVNHWVSNWNFSEELQNQKTIVVTDARLNIVFATENILQMTGYQNDEVIGKSPKMFQGVNTSKKDLEDMKTAINLEQPFEKTLVNYKKNGETYACKIQAFPVFNSKKKLVNFVAFEIAA